jgi:hypothetical protein
VKNDSNGITEQSNYNSGVLRDGRLVVGHKKFMAQEKWEYKFAIFTLVDLETGGPDEGERILNSEGSDGWEAVSFINGMGADRSWCVTLLKRPSRGGG